MQRSESHTRVWKHVAAALSVVGAAALVHCSSQAETDTKSSTASSTGGSNVQAARQFFLDNVYGQIQPTCASCHASGDKGAPIWMSNNGEGTYNAIDGISGYIAAPNASPLMQKGLHSGPALTQQQNDTMFQWLKREVEARKLSGDDGRPPNLREGFKRFGACMSYKRWVELKLNTIALTDTENNQGQCRSCHNGGQSSLWLSGIPEEEFMKFTQYPYVQKLVVGKVNASGAFDGLQGSRRMIDKGSEAQQQQANSHPRFTLPAEVATNIVTYVSETLSNMNANRCEGGDKPDAGPDAAPQN